MIRRNNSSFVTFVNLNVLRPADISFKLFTDIGFEFRLNSFGEALHGLAIG
jgi:hypothetical protein